MVHRWFRTGAFLIGAALLAAPASAQVIQSFQIGVGAFLPNGFSSRVVGDVLVADLTAQNPLFFRISDLRSAEVSGEWNVAFGHHIEVGAGVGYYRRTAPSTYRDLVNPNGTEILQDLRLRIVPITGVVRFLPFGKEDRVQPYAGVGVSALMWRYSEVGDFVDDTTLKIFPGRNIASGTAVAPVLLGGLRIPIKGDIYAFTFETRYQWGSGDTGGIENGFIDNKIDLGGTHITFGFLVRF